MGFPEITKVAKHPLNILFDWDVKTNSFWIFKFHVLSVLLTLENFLHDLVTWIKSSLDNITFYFSRSSQLQII